MVDTAALLGTWNMTSWKREIVANGEKIDALGPDPIGYINYGPDGRFYALVVSRNRLTPATLPPSDAEKLKLFDSMLAYAELNRSTMRKPFTMSMRLGTKHGPGQIRCVLQTRGRQANDQQRTLQRPTYRQRSRSSDRVSTCSKTKVICPLLAQSGHSELHRNMSAFGGKADMTIALRNGVPPRRKHPGLQFNARGQTFGSECRHPKMAQSGQSNRTGLYPLLGREGHHNCPPDNPLSQDHFSIAADHKKAMIIKSVSLAVSLRMSRCRNDYSVSRITYNAPDSRSRRCSQFGCNGELPQRCLGSVCRPSQRQREVLSGKRATHPRKA